MRHSSSLRLGIALCGTLFVCLCSVAIADAAPSRARAVSLQLCKTQARPCRVKARSSKVAQQPAQYFVRVQRLVRRHPGAWLERSRPDPLRENEDAAFWDRTAVVTGEDDLLLASLEPLGVLATLRSPVTISADLIRHSPRGPPQFPGFV